MLENQTSELTHNIRSNVLFKLFESQIRYHIELTLIVGTAEKSKASQNLKVTEKIKDLIS